MHIELVDLLRCPRAHDETWLVAASDRMDGREIVDGTLGCPVCEATYPIRGGAVYFVAATPTPVGGEPDDEQVMRAAAMLGLSEGGGVVVLAGAWGRYAVKLGELAEAHYLLVNPDGAVRGSVVYAAGVPVAAGSARAAAASDAADLPAMVAAVRAGGRLVAPAGAAVPDGVRELARDERNWVGEVVGPAPTPVLLMRKTGTALP